MKRSTILLVAILLMCGMTANAQESGAYDWVRGSTSGSSIWSPLIITGTISDTTIPFYFNLLMPYGSVRFKSTHIRTSATSLLHPKISYKYVDKDGKWFGDSVNAWIPLTGANADSLAHTITAGDTVRHLKVYDFRATGPEGVVFMAQGPKTNCSCKVWIGVVGAKKNKYDAYPPIW